MSVLILTRGREQLYPHGDPMSDLTEKAREIFQKNGMAFLLGWILGMGLGQSLWDSIVGVL